MVIHLFAQIFEYLLGEATKISQSWIQPSKNVEVRLVCNWHHVVKGY